MDFKLGDRVKWHKFGIPGHRPMRGAVVGLFIRHQHVDGSHEIGYRIKVGKRVYSPRPDLVQRDDWYRRIVYRLTPRSSVVGQVSASGSSTKSVAVSPDE